jgi:exonuclease VII small subunit
MKCSCCDVILTTQESVRKFRNSGEYVDMCNKCLSTISDDVQVVDGEAEDDEQVSEDE